MPISCSIVGCKNKFRANADKSFYRLPAVNNSRFSPERLNLLKLRRAKWLANIARKDITDSKASHMRICSDHFVNGKPARLEDPEDPDWAPTQNLPFKKTARKPDLWYTRHRRILEREKKKERKPPKALLNLHNYAAKIGSDVPSKENEDEPPGNMIAIDSSNLETTSESSTPDVILGLHNYAAKTLNASTKEIVAETSSNSGLDHDAHVAEPEIQMDVTVECWTEPTTFATVACQTDETLTGYKQQYEDMIQLRSEIYDLRSQVKSLELSEDTVKDDDDRVSFYTGLKDFATLMQVFQLVSLNAKHSLRCKLTPFQEFFLFLMHLRLNLSFRYLSYRFGISMHTVSRIFEKWVDLAARKMKNFIIWPAREELMDSMPAYLSKHFTNNVAVIVDCFEVKMAPFTHCTDSISWSDCKHNRTIKFLIGLSPDGCISFISRGYSGNNSDSSIIQNCSILDNLFPGDVVLANSGFGLDCKDQLYCASLSAPSEVDDELQLEEMEAETKRKLVKVKMHLEKVLGLVRRKYQILQGPVPNELVKSNEKESETVLDKVLSICFGLVNICTTLDFVTEKNSHLFQS